MKLFKMLWKLMVKYRFAMVLTVLISFLVINPLKTSQATNNNSPLIGQWRSQVQFTTGGFAAVDDLEFMYSFNLGGTMTESSNYDGAPPVPPAYGIWRQIENNKFEAKYEYYATGRPENSTLLDIWDGWRHSTRGVLTENITINGDGTSFTSTITYEAFDRDDNLVADGGGIATGRGVKLKF